MSRQAPFLEISTILPENGPAIVECVTPDIAETEIGRKSVYLLDRLNSEIISYLTPVVNISSGHVTEINRKQSLCFNLYGIFS